MKHFLTMIFLICSLLCVETLAGEIPNIKDTGIIGFEVVYPIRDNALVIILQPCPDNSGDFMFTVCNKQSHCYQTSMLNNEVRYIGLFLEDLGGGILSNLYAGNETNWASEQKTFRTLYADYMNKYDETFSALKSFTELGNKKE